MKKHLIPFWLSLVLLAFAGQGASAAVWTIPTFDIQAWNYYSGVGSVAYWSAKKKVYVGVRTYTPNRRGLVVFDTDTGGNIIGQGRRYLSHPSEETPGHWTMVQSMLVDTRHTKLFLGLSDSHSTLTTALVMISLDSAGEPTGSPQAYSTGQPYNNVQAMALHPTLNRLYMVGWGCPGIYARDLDTNGVPTGTPLSWSIGGQGKFSITVRSNGAKVYLGTYPGICEVSDMTSGAPSGTPRSYTATGVAGYLICSANNKGVYYKTDSGYLAYWAVTGAGEPSGSPVVTSTAVQNLQATSSNTLATCNVVTFTDAITAQTKTSGFKTREYSLNSNGSLNAILNETAAVDRRTASLLNTSPSVCVADSYLSGFLGNRYKDLSMRTTLNWVEPNGDMTASSTDVTMSGQGVYLRFCYSSRWNKVYATDGSNINIYNLTTGALESNVACANAASPVVVDDQTGAYGKLYVALTNGNVDARDLNANGIPAATGTITTTGMGIIGAMVVNPVSHHIYLCGAYGTPGTIAGTNYIRLPGSYYFCNTDVDTVKGRVYVVSAYNANQNIWVWKLNGDGTLNGTTATTYNDGLPLGSSPWRGDMGSVAVNSAKSRLYVVGDLESLQGANQGMLVVYTLDANGDPTGTPRSYNVPNVQGAVDSLTLSTDKTKVYTCGWGDPRIYYFSLNTSGDPSGNASSLTVGPYGHLPTLLFTADGTKFLTGSYPSVLHVVAMNSDGTCQYAPSGTFNIPGQSINYGMLKPGVASGWTNLNTALQNGSSSALGTLSLTGGTVARGKVTFDFSLDGGATILATRAVDVRGNATSVYLPQYDIDAARLPKLADWVESSGMHHRWLKSNYEPDPLPKQYVIADHFCGSEANVDSLGAALETMADAGTNTIEVGGSGITSDAVHNAAVAAGMPRFKWGIYNPPSMFDYNTEYFTPGYQDSWAAGKRTEIANAFGAKPDEVALFHMADEPGWYFPTVLNDVNDPGHTERVAVFRAYLQNKGFTPAFFGEAGWDTVNPIGLSAATTLEKRRLLYWTARWYAESNANAFAASTAALQGQLNANLLVTTNLNNWPGSFFIPSPNTPIANNPIVGPDTAMGMPDWFELGRKKGVSCIWTEDWFGDTYAGAWSMYADLLRSAAREGTGVSYGAYVVGQPLGKVPDGGKYKVMSLAGHGAKAFDSYVFGPYQVFADGWADNTRAYPAYAGAYKLLAKAESVLYPGQPRTGKLAILLPKASQVWDATNTGKAKLYMNEVYGLYYALVHCQYPVDFVDDYDIEAGKLATYGYTVLYVSAPNLSVTAQTAIQNWVNAGGALVMLPGACAYDEYNTAATTLQSLMGASWGTVDRVDTTGMDISTARTTITVTDQATLGAATDVTPGQIAGLTVTTATSLATVPGGLSAVTKKTYGAGSIWAFGYWPGGTYAALIDNWDSTHLPYDWRTDTRQILTAPCRSAGTAKFVSCTVPLVECPLLESTTNGIGITLLNWTGTSQSITASVNKLTMPTPILNLVNAAIAGGTLKVSSVEKGDLTYTVNGNNIDIALSLSTVDVLMLTW